MNIIWLPTVQICVYWQSIQATQYSQWCTTACAEAENKQLERCIRESRLIWQHQLTPKLKPDHLLLPSFLCNRLGSPAIIHQEMLQGWPKTASRYLVDSYYRERSRKLWTYLVSGIEQGSELATSLASTSFGYCSPDLRPLDAADGPVLG
jgi:hypothetical protein